MDTNDRQPTQPRPLVIPQVDADDAREEREERRRQKQEQYRQDRFKK